MVETKDQTKGLPVLDPRKIEALLSRMEREGLVRPLKAGEASGDQLIDEALLEAMDVISGSIEEHDSRWQGMLDSVEADLQAVSAARSVPAPSAA